MLNSGVSEPRDLSPRLHFPPIRRDKPGGSLLSLRLSDKEVAPLFSKRPIRLKLLIGLGLLVVMVAILASSGLYTTYAYRNLVKSLSWRVSELPLAAEVNSHVNKLRIDAERVARAAGRSGPRRPRRPGAAAGPPGPRAVPRRAGRSGRGGGRISPAGRADHAGRLRPGRQPARTRRRPQDRGRPRTHSRDRKRSQLDLQRGAGRPHGRRVGWAARAGGGIVQPAARQAERVRRRGPRAVSHACWWARGSPASRRRRCSPCSCGCFIAGFSGRCGC